MTQEEFEKFMIEGSRYGEYIVEIALRYTWEKKYRYINEYMRFTPEYGIEYPNDWHEGETDVIITGFCDIDDVDAPYQGVRLGYARS